jgi:hypothetical protein
MFHVHAACICYQIIAHVSDVLVYSCAVNAAFACNAGGGSNLHSNTREHDAERRSAALPKHEYRWSLYPDVRLRLLRNASINESPNHASAGKK